MTAVGVVIGLLLLGIVVYGGGYFLVSYLSDFLGIFGAIIVTFIIFILIVALIKQYDKYRQRKA